MNFALRNIIVMLWGLRVFAYGTLMVISEKTGEIVRSIEERNIRSMSDSLEGYVIPSLPLNACDVPELPPMLNEDGQGENNETTRFPRNYILLAVVYDCDLTTKARNAQLAGYAGLIVQNIGTNNSQLVPWQSMRFPLAKINHVVVGEYDGYLLRFNYSYPYHRYYIKFQEDHFYQVLCYVLAGIIMLLLSTIFALFWFQLCCTIFAMRLPHRVGQGVQRWLHPGKRRLTRPMLQLIPVKNWTPSDPFQTCAVCQEDFKEDEKVRVLPCSHTFHSVCIDPWLLKRSRRCPNCMQRVKLPTDPEDDEDSEYSSTHTVNRNTSRRRCSGSQSSHHDNRPASNGNDSDPLLDLTQSPKNRPTQEDHQGPLYTGSPDCSITINDETSTNRDWQLKHFLENFNYVPSEDSQSQKTCSDSKKEPKEPLGHQKVKDIPLHSMKVSVENLLETCIDGYSSFHVSVVDASGPGPVDEEDPPLTFTDFNDPENTHSQSTPNATEEEGITLHRLVHFTATAHSNPGYISNDDSPEVTEENDLSSSFDATTISESLPRDDSLLISHPVDFGSIREFPMEDECPLDFDNEMDNHINPCVVVICDKLSLEQACDENIVSPTDGEVNGSLTDKASRAHSHDAQATDDLI